MKKLFSFFVLMSLYVLSFGQCGEKDKDVKTGWNLGLIPVVSYNSDLGFQYGALTNIYSFGDGKAYPKYYHSIYAEVSRYTKGSGIYRLFYDSEFLIPKIRLTADISYLPDQALDFFGFNGYDAVYNKIWEDISLSEYKSRLYYNHQRNVFRAKADFQGKTGVANLNWAAGYDFLNIQVGSVPVEKLNKGSDSTNMLPLNTSLYDDYVKWGVIRPEEESGGQLHNMVVSQKVCMF
ncbi:MAG: hypothetical protein GX879_03395 [Bacteroidales bacterium]|nr:hypothetical protein [Bacteroidales bacterium]